MFVLLIFACLFAFLSLRTLREIMVHAKAAKFDAKFAKSKIQYDIVFYLFTR